MTRKRINLVGKKFGKLTVLAEKRVRVSGSMRKIVLVRCGCGLEYSRPAANLKNTKQCKVCSDRALKQKRKEQHNEVMGRKDPFDERPSKRRKR